MGIGGDDEHEIRHVPGTDQQVGGHVEAIETNIRTNGGSPVEPTTWSQIKNFFKELLR